MTPHHFETIVDGSRAPLSAAYARNQLNPKTVTVFSMPAHLEEIGRLTHGVDCRRSQWSTSQLNRVAEGTSNCD